MNVFPVRLRVAAWLVRFAPHAAPLLRGRGLPDDHAGAR